MKPAAPTHDTCGITLSHSCAGKLIWGMLGSEMLVGVVWLIIFVLVGWWLALRMPRCEISLLTLPHSLSNIMPTLSAYCEVCFLFSHNRTHILIALQVSRSPV